MITTDRLRDLRAFGSSDTDAISDTEVQEMATELLAWRYPNEKEPAPNPFDDEQLFAQP